MSSKWESILILPHLEVENVSTFRKNLFVRCRTKRRPMPCLVCASKCEAIYDQRKVKLRDCRVRAGVTDWKSETMLDRRLSA